MIRELSKKKKKNIYTLIFTLDFFFNCIIMAREGEVPINVYTDLRSKIVKKKKKKKIQD